jgi:enoyl-CoA hydratase/carnithine racemase
MAILERHDKNAVAHLQMNAPERLNALSDEMLAALQAQIDALKDDTSIKAVILSGIGKAFCAGHDIRQMTAGRAAEDKGQSYFEGLFARCTSVMLGLQNLPQPVIAQVHGIATAAGCQLVASCDLAVATDDCRFGVNGVNIGLFCSTPMVALSRNIPRKHAFELLTTGVPAEQLEAETRALADKIAAKLGAAVKVGKEAYYQQLQMPIEEAYAYTSKVIVTNLMQPDTIEGMQAFIEKRSPDWK